MNHDRIRPYESNTAYWQYRGRPVLLLGGSDEDNIFQIPGTEEEARAAARHGDGIVFDPTRINLEAQLSSLADCGGNFLRCTMSCRDVGDVWPYARDGSSGRYDLSKWDETFWERLRRFLEMTAERQIIVQIEIWATYDFYQREVRPGVFPWLHNPYNPRNNVNYTAVESGLPEAIDSDGCREINPFFETVPALGNNTLVRTYQRRYVDRLLALCFEFDHVLYCVDNETNAHPEWAAYWAAYVRERAAKSGVDIETTEMWDTFDPTDGSVSGVKRRPTDTNPFVIRSTPLNCLKRPDLYTYFDISNHNAQSGETHFRTAHWFRRHVHESGRILPIVCDKMYGGDSGKDFAGTRKDGLERFWRNIFAGLAGCRFHRPPAGIGIDDDARAHIRAMRMLTDALDVFSCRPAPELLSDREENTAFCLADPGRAYAVAFVNPGACSLDVGATADKTLRLRWLDVAAGAWRAPENAAATGRLRLQTPGAGFYAVLVEG